jgi:hypothetical protein
MHKDSEDHNHNSPQSFYTVNQTVIQLSVESTT